MNTGAVTTLKPSHELAWTGSSSWEFDPDYGEQTRNIAKLLANLRDEPASTHLDTGTVHTILEADHPPESTHELAAIRTSAWPVWPVYAQLRRVGSPILSRGVLPDYQIWEAAAYIQDFAEQVGRVERAFETRQKYLCRIKQLRDYAEEDGNLVSWASEKDFWSFVESAPLVDRAGLVLMDNGNLRAIWKSDDGSRVGIQFLGGGMAEFVIFKRRPATPEVSRVAGIDTLKGIKSQIRTFHLNSLVNV